MMKRKLGQYFTNEIIADFMTELIVRKETKMVLDPAVGPGIFVRSFQKYNQSFDITVFDVDDAVLKQYHKNVTLATEIRKQDYLSSFDDKKYDAIICNPPYNKFQEIKNRQELRTVYKRKYDIDISGYANYYVYFLVKSLAELTEHGTCAFIIPYEFLNTGYGTSVKQYLLDSKRLSAIVRFDNHMKLFDDATTTSCILFFDGDANDTVQFFNIQSLEELSIAANLLVNRNMQETLQDQKIKMLQHEKQEKNLQKELEDHKISPKSYSYQQLKSNQKWNQYFDEGVTNGVYRNLIPLNTVASVKRGIASGNNDYFGLNEEMIAHFGLSKNVCVPCINKARHVTWLKLTQNRFDELSKKNKKVYLFDGEKASNENDYEYIKRGEELGIPNLYLTSHRTPWYKVEKKDAPPIFLSVFNRSGLKVVRNEAMVKSLTTFHGLYPFSNKKEDIDLLFCYLLTEIGQEILYLNKREYGQGLDKFEPSDLNKAMILDLNVISEQDRKKIMNLYQTLDGTEFACLDSIKKELNEVFKNYIQGIDS